VLLVVVTGRQLIQTDRELQLLQLQHLQTQALEVVLAQGIPHRNMQVATAVQAL
jgi:hypothetical protein